MQIKFRPHHFLCTLCFQGRGYSPTFIRNYQTIVDELNKRGDSTMISIVEHTDSICDPCPNRIGQLCTTEEKISGLDKNHAATLKLQANDFISWGEAKKRIKENLTLDRFHQICSTCGWKKFGFCESVLKEFLKKEY